MGLFNWQTEQNIEGHKLVAYKGKNGYQYELDGNKSPNIFISELEAIENAKEVIKTSKLMQEAMSIKPGNIHEYMGYEIEIVKNGSTYCAIIEETGTEYAQKITGRPGEEARTPEDALSMAYSYCSDDYKLQLQNGRPNTFHEAVLTTLSNYATPQQMMEFLELVENKDPRAFIAHRDFKNLYAKSVAQHMYEIHYEKEFGIKVSANFSNKTITTEDGCVRTLDLNTVADSFIYHNKIVDEDDENEFYEKMTSTLHESLMKDWRESHPKDAQYECNDPNWVSTWGYLGWSLFTKSPKQVRELSEEIRKKEQLKLKLNKEPLKVKEFNRELHRRDRLISKEPAIQIKELHDKLRNIYLNPNNEKLFKEPPSGHFGIHAGVKDDEDDEPVMELVIENERIIFCCPVCRRKIRVAGKHAGKKGACPHCGNRVPIPKAS
jgi:hypothetical protein